MGYGEVGGGGSVHWNVEVDNADPSPTKWPDTAPPRRRRAGVDQNHGRYFAVTVRQQGRPFTSVGDFLTWLQGTGPGDGQLVVQGGRATFLVEIGNTASPSTNVHQIQIRWDGADTTI
jgi:hypothetical protein